MTRYSPGGGSAPPIISDWRDPATAAASADGRRPWTCLSFKSTFFNRKSGFFNRKSRFFHWKLTSGSAAASARAFSPIIQYKIHHFYYKIPHFLLNKSWLFQQQIATLRAPAAISSSDGLYSADSIFCLSKKSARCWSSLPRSSSLNCLSFYMQKPSFLIQNPSFFIQNRIPVATCKIHPH